MASVDLTGLPIQSSVPSLLEYGGTLSPALGGPEQQIDRLGTRWSWQFQIAPMAVEPDGRRWAALIGLAKRDGAILPIRLPNFNPGAPGNPTVAADTASGRLVPIAGMAPNHPIRLGQWVSIIHGGRRYLDQVVADGFAAADGTATLTIRNLLRTPLTTGDSVELALPKVEGILRGELSWPLNANRTTSFVLTLGEAA